MIIQGLRYLISFSLVCLTACTSQAQADRLTLEECYRLARENYPAVKQMDLIAKTADHTIRKANKSFLPQFTVAGQATYQSQTIDYGELLGGVLPAGFTLPAFSRDQYRISGEVEQLLFDDGNTRYQHAITKASASLQKQNIAVELYALHDRINSIFFSIFLLDARLALNDLKLSDLQSRLGKTASAYQYGTAYASDVNDIKAEIESTKSVNMNYEGSRSAFLKMLSMFIGKTVTSSSALVKPEPVLSGGEIERPELKIFDLRKNLYEAQAAKLKSGYLPRLSAFFQGAYGRPTLNPVSNDFGPWYITGIRLKWSFGSLYTLKDQRAIYRLNSRAADIDKETFLRNVKMDMVQEDENIRKYAEMIRQDKKTIALREAVTRSASAQLSNGVITTHEYLQKLNNENAAKQNLILHQIQWLQAQYHLKFQSGHELIPAENER